MARHKAPAEERRDVKMNVAFTSDEARRIDARRQELAPTVDGGVSRSDYLRSLVAADVKWNRQAEARKAAEEARS